MGDGCLRNDDSSGKWWQMQRTCYCTALQPQKMREEFLCMECAQACILCYCTIQYIGVTQYSTSIVVYTRSLHRHTLATMSVRKKAKCEETMTVPHSTMESEHCEDEANNWHIVQPRLLKNLSYYMPWTRKHTPRCQMAALWCLLSESNVMKKNYWRENNL